jgi:hypothetical protein
MLLPAQTRSVSAAHYCQELRRRPRAGNAVTSYHLSVPRSCRRPIDARESRLCWVSALTKWSSSGRAASPALDRCGSFGKRCALPDCPISTLSSVKHVARRISKKLHRLNRERTNKTSAARQPAASSMAATGFHNPSSTFLSILTAANLAATRNSMAHAWARQPPSLRVKLPLPSG